MNKPMSRQRRDQIRNREAGLCLQCRAPSPEKTLCDRCHEKRTPCVRKRHVTGSQWSAVDWNLNDTKIAEMLGVTTATVRNNRRKYGHPKPRKSRKSRLRQATELLREIAEKDEAALTELGDIGLDLPEETRAFLNRSRAFLGMSLL